MPADTDRRAADARALRDVAEAAPETVDPTRLWGFIEDPDPGVHRPAIAAMRTFAEAEPIAAAEGLDRLMPMLSGADRTTRTRILQTADAVARARPDAVAPHLGAVIDHIDPGVDPIGRRIAARVVALVAAEHPTPAIDAIPRLEVFLRGEDRQLRRTAIAAVAYVGSAYPHELLPLFDDLVAALESDDPGVLQAALVALGDLSTTTTPRPEAVIEGAMPLVHHDDDAVRVNATGVIGDTLGRTPHLERSRYFEGLLDPLGDPDAEVRANAMTAIAGLAVTSPALIRAHVHPVETRLDDDTPRVRERACFALGAAEATDAEDRLLRVAREDPDPGVSERAEWALERFASGRRQG